MKLENGAAVLFVKDAAISRDFYVGLGMEVIADFGGMNIVFKERFAVWQISDGNIITNRLTREKIEDKSSISRFEMAFETHNLDEVYEYLTGQNVKFLHEINTEAWGQRNIRFYDPDGHLVEVGEAMPVFLKRVLDEHQGDVEATAQVTFMPSEMIKQILGV